MKDAKDNSKQRKAAALKYNVKTNAVPFVVGVGSGLVAENMIKQAQDHQVPIVENSKAAHALAALGIGVDIPEELYQVIAEILVFVAGLDQDKGERFGLDDSVRQPF